MSLHRASVLLATFTILAALVSSIAFTRTNADGATGVVVFASAAPNELSPTPAVTPVTPLPPPFSPTSSGDSANNTGEYIVIAVVLGIMTSVVAGFVVLWFVVD